MQASLLTYVCIVHIKPKIHLKQSCTYMANHYNIYNIPLNTRNASNASSVGVARPRTTYVRKKLLCKAHFTHT